MKNGVVYWSEGTEHEMTFPGPLLGVRVRVYCDADTIVTVANDTQSSFAAEPGNITEMNMNLPAAITTAANETHIAESTIAAEILPGNITEMNMTLAAAIITDANETHVADNTVAAETLPENITEMNMTLAVAITTDANETHVADNTVAAETLPENITETNLTVVEVDAQTMSESNYAVRGIAMPFITAAVGGMMIFL
jgi:hypothetical protein